MRSNAPFHTKLEAWYHLTANLSYPLMIVLSTLLMPAMIIRSYQGWVQMMLIDFPLFMASTMSVSSFYLVSQKELFPRRWTRTFLYLPCLMGLGVGLTITNTKAVLEALFGVQSAFARTPKAGIRKKGEKSQAHKYRKRLGIVPWIELLIGCYFAFTIWYAITSENYFTVPLPGPVRLRLLVYRPPQPPARPLRVARPPHAGRTPRKALPRRSLASSLERAGLQSRRHRPHHKIGFSR